MYPYFTLRWHKLYAVGIGIVISALVFLGTARYHSRKQKVQFTKLFFRLPTLLIACYLLGNRAWLALESGIWFPLRSFKTLGARLSPYGYNFHFVWLIIGATFAWRRFFKKIFMRTERYKRVNVLFYAFAASLIPLWFFLLLGDTFVGKPTEAWYGVVALLNDSKRTNFGRVLPLWILVSIIWFVSYGVVLLCSRLLQKERTWWYLWFAIIFLWFMVVFLGQHYPRHWVMQLFGYTRDVKNYIALLLAIYFFVQFMHTPKKR